jgi:hypothetical protein
MKHRLLPALAMVALTTSPVFAQDDEETREGETEQEKEERLAAQAGKFNAGFKVRMPNGPGDDGTYGQFNWIGVDLTGRYNVTDAIGVGGTLYTAPVKPDFPDGAMMEDPKVFGGFMARPELRLGSTIGAFVDVGFLTYGAVLLSEKDIPIYQGDYELATRVGPWVKLKANVVYLSILPALVFQNGDPEKIAGFQLPVNAMLRAGEMLKVSADVGLYSGDDFKVGADDGGRIAIGAAVDIKVGAIALHLGAGLNSLLTSDNGPYDTIGHSLYFDVAAKYLK